MSPAAPRRYLVNFPRLGAGRNSRAGHRQASWDSQAVAMYQLNGLADFSTTGALAN
jgi:hypothetical protein